MRKKIIVKQLGSFEQDNQLIKFACKLPSYCKELTGISLFSPEMVIEQALELNAELSLWVNNNQTPVGNVLFTLGFHEVDNQECRMMDVNQGLDNGKELRGYVRYLAGKLPFGIHLILECRM